MKEATCELDPEGWSNLVQEREGMGIAGERNNQQRQKQGKMGCVLEQCSLGMGTKGNIQKSNGDQTWPRTWREKWGK